MSVSMNSLTNAYQYGAAAPDNASLWAMLNAGGSGGGGGLAGLASLAGTVSPILGGLGAIAGLFGGGMSKLEKEQLAGMQQQRQQRGSIFSLLNNRLAQSGNEPMQNMAKFEASQAMRRNQRGAMLDANLGLDSGVAAGSLARSDASDSAGFYLDQLNQGRNYQQNLLQMLSGLV